MANTKKISLFYQLTPTEIISPPADAVSRKDSWVKEIQAGIEAEWKPRLIKVTYELYNPDVAKLLKFFNGPVVEYFVIQSAEIAEGRPTSLQKKQYRELLLEESLGYDVVLPGGKHTRRRKSTADFQSTQKWTDFLETLKETQFESQGYEFPDSEDFWKLAEKLGTDRATEESIKQLQARIAGKLSTP